MFNITSCGIRIESHQAYPDCSYLHLWYPKVQYNSSFLSFSAHLFYFPCNLLIVYLELKRLSAGRNGHLSSRIVKLRQRENQVLCRFIINIQVANAAIRLILTGHRIIAHREDNLQKMSSFFARFLQKKEKLRILKSLTEIKRSDEADSRAKDLRIIRFSIIDFQARSNGLLQMQ